MSASDPIPAVPPARRRSTPLLVTYYGIAAALLVAAGLVHLIAPEGATVNIPTRRCGQRDIEVGLWPLYIPFALALLATWYAASRLSRAKLGRRYYSWLVLLAAGPAVLFAIVAFDALG